MTFSLAPVKARFIDKSACLFSTVPTNIQHFNLVKRNATDNDNLVKANVTDNDNCNADNNDQDNAKAKATTKIRARNPKVVTTPVQDPFSICLPH